MEGLIDRKALCEEIKRQANGIRLGEITASDIDTELIIQLIVDFPTVDAEVIKRGKWINEPPYKAVGGTYKGQECSVCHSYFVSDGNTPYSNHPYCCECGARMDGVK